MLACLLVTTVLHATAQDLSLPLIVIGPTPPSQSSIEHDEPELLIAPGVPRARVFDPVLMSAPFRAVLPPVAAFEGIGAGIPGSGSSSPPDSNSAVGPNHVVEVTNGLFMIFDKGGRVLFGPSYFSAIWQGFPGTCGLTIGHGDPVALYDRLADRWVLTTQVWDMRDGFAHQCVAVSQSGDPLGSWYRYQFPYSSPNDYGKIGLWPDAYVFSTFLGAPGEALICAFDRARMLVGAVATQQCFPAPQNEPQPFPADLDGDRPPPAGAAAYLISSPVQGTFGVFRLHVDWSSPAASSLSARQGVAVAPWNPAFDALAVTQPGTSQGLTASTGILRHRLAYRNFGDHEAIVTAHTVDAGGGVIGLRWYELRPDGKGGLQIFQQGTFAPDSDHRFMPSVAMDAKGNLAIGYSVSSKSVYPSLRYSARIASDPPGELTIGEGSLFEGAFSQTWALRWGDYFSMQIDPVDGCTFWFTGEYAGQSETGTRISAFRLPGCGVHNDFSLLILPATQQIQAGSVARYEIKTAVASGTADEIRLSVTGLPSSATVAFAPAAVAAGATSTLTVAVPQDAAPSTATFTVAGTSASAAHEIAASLVIRPGSSDAGAPDASTPADGGEGDAGDGGVTAADAGDGGVTAADAGDGGVAAADAGDGGVSAADAGDGGVAGADAGDGGSSDSGSSSSVPPATSQGGSAGCSTAGGSLAPMLLALLALRGRARRSSLGRDRNKKLTD